MLRENICLESRSVNTSVKCDLVRIPCVSEVLVPSKQDAAPTESLLNWQDYEGRTPLHFAVADGNMTVADVLTSYESCNITSYDNLFRTPLHWAALLGELHVNEKDQP